jgi:hypothetical protein
MDGSLLFDGLAFEASAVDGDDRRIVNADKKSTTRAGVLDRRALLMTHRAPLWLVGVGNHNFSRRVMMTNPIITTVMT